MDEGELCVSVGYGDEANHDDVHLARSWQEKGLS
jgi:hypothetical protein